MYAQSKHKHNTYSIVKNGYVHKAIILSKINILASNVFTQMFNVLYCVSKVSAVVQVNFPAYALPIHKQNVLRITKGNTSNRISP